MKKFLIILFIFIFAMSAQAAEKPSKTNKSKPEKTDTAKPIKRIDTMIAVFDLETSGNVDKYVSRPLSESIRREVFKSGKWELIDRGNMDKMLGEQKFQLSGCVTGQCIVEAGQMLGVGKIVAGTVSLIGKTYYLSLSLINAETGKIEAQSEDKCKCELDELIDSSKRLISKLIGESTGTPVKEQTQKNFSLEDLEKKRASEEVSWNAKMQEMKKAYNQVIEYEKKDVKPQQKADAWKYFLESFSEDNPHSTEDDKMRQKAKGKEKAEYWHAIASGKIIDPTTGMEFVSVKGGCFQMGDTFGDGDSDEKPVHEACVDDFYIGKYEVTVEQFRKFVNETGYRTEAEKGDGCYYYTGSEWKTDSSKNWKNPGFSQDESHPVACVSWNDAVAFTDWLKRKTGKNYRLPTEAEWEYAAKSGGKNEKYSGSNDVDSVAWYTSNSGGKTHPVGTKSPNGLGIYDMSGNVWEWVNDWYDKDYYKNSPKDNPNGPNSGSYRVARGGSWDYRARRVRASLRDRRTPNDRFYDLGFRLAGSQ